MSRGPKWLKFQYAMQNFETPISTLTSVVTPPFDLGSGEEVFIQLPPDLFRRDGKMREEFFCRHFPWRDNPSRTKVCATVFLVAAKNSVTRIEGGLEEFLASGVIANGADKANAAANSQASVPSN